MDEFDEILLGPKWAGTTKKNAEEKETEHLIASPKNAERLAASIRQARVGGAREQLIGVDGEGRPIIGHKENE